MAVSMDLGNLYSPYGIIHPADKKDVGIRLAHGSLSIAYGKNVYSGPLVSEIVQLKESLTVALKVVFKSVFRKIEVRSCNGLEVHICNIILSLHGVIT